MNQFYQASKMNRKDWHAPAPGINNCRPWLVGLSISIESSLKYISKCHLPTQGPDTPNTCRKL